MQLEKVSEDARGSIHLIRLPEGMEAILIHTNRGYVRGGEYHRSGQRTLILSGKLRWTVDDLFSGHLQTHTQKRGETYFIPSMVAHMAEALEDTTYVEWLDGDLGKTMVPEMRKVVEDRMKNGPPKA